MKQFRTLLSLLLALSMVLSCIVGVSAATVDDIVPAEETTTPSALTLGALSQEFKAINAHKYADTDTVRAIIVLESAPEADIEGSDALKSAYRLRLNKEHAAVKKAMTMAYEPVHEFTAVLNGFSCDVAYGELENIAKIDGVASVHIANHYDAPRLEKPQNNQANTVIGNAVMNKNGFKGKGIVVAVLDTGLHVTHEAFKVYSGMPITSKLTSSSISKTSVSGKYISAKVPFTYDYADKDNNVADSHGHGTHVSGTAVGYAESSDGGVKMSGGAPAAQLVAMKIFKDAGGGTSTDIYFSALDDAYKLGVDVVNMSIGAQNGFTYDSSLEGTFGNIYQRMADAGIVMCVAAGNEYSMAKFSSVGFIGSEYMDFGTIASPAAYEGNVSIAAVENIAYPNYSITFNGKTFVYIDSCQDGTHGWLQKFGGKSTSVVVLKNAAGTDLAMGTEADFAKVNVRNKIAVVSRGEISFQEKMDFAANAGAVGVIVVNNEAGSISMSIDPFAIPAISVDISTKEAFLTASSTATLSTASTASTVENPSALQMCDFSNWGTSPMLTIDPTISSIGGNVYSSMPTGNSDYDLMSGTSMACPSAAGTFAALLEAVRAAGAASSTAGSSRKELTKIQATEKAIALMESTGIILKDAEDYMYSVRKQGAGLATSENSYNVYHDGAYISNPIQELGDDKNKTGVYTMTLTLVNDGYKTVTYDKFNTYVLTDLVGKVGDITAHALQSDLMYNGNTGNATVTYKVNGSSVSSITLKPTESKTVTVTITMNSTAKNYYDTNFPNGAFVEGFVSFSNSSGMETHATFLAFYGDWEKGSAMEKISSFDFLQANYILNNEIYQNGKTYAEAGLTLGDVLLEKFGPFYTDMNMVYTINSSGEPVNYLGGHPRDVGNENSIYRPEYNAFSTSSGNGGYLGMLIYPRLLRNARSVRMTIKDKNTGTTYLTTTENYIPKDRYDGENSQWTPHVSFQWKGTKSASSSTLVPSGTTATVTLDVMLPYGQSANRWQTKVMSFDVTVDYTAPVVSKAVYDSSKQLVSVTASDSQYLASIILCDSSGQTIHAEKTFSPSAKGESCTAIFDVSGISNKNMAAVALDYASNQGSKTVTSGTVSETEPDPTTPTQPQPTEPTQPTEDPGDDNTVDNYSYNLVTSASQLTAGEYIIIAVGSDGTYYTLSTAQDGTYKCMQSEAVGLSSVASAISCDSATAAALGFTLSGNANGFTLSTDKGSLYAYSGNDGVGLYYGNASTWTGSYNSSSKGFTLKSGSMYLSLRDDAGINGDNGYPIFALAASTSTGTTLMHMYKKQAPAACTHANTTTSTIPATCTQDGETVVTCKDCGVTVSTTVIPATGHNTATSTTNATCTTAGKTVEYCKTCNVTLKTTEIPALGHDYKYASNNNGTHKITCSRCSYSSSANCSLVNNKCSYCGYTYVAPTEPTEPTLPDEPEVPVTDLTTGQYVIAAKVNDTYYAMSNTFASKINGSEIAVNGGKVAAADAEGYIVNLTSVDGGWTIDNGAGNYLKYNSSTNLASTTSPYTWIIEAGVNGTWRVTSSASATRGLVFRAKTYNQFGGYSLTNCTAGSTEYYDVEILPIDGVVEPELPEVCTHENTTSQTTNATCTTAGKVVVSCKDCGEVLSTESIPALGHDYKYTSNNNGTHKITCSRCDYTATENCDLNNGTCPDCGYVEPTIPDEPEVPVGELKDGQYVIAANVDGVYYAMSNGFASKINGAPITVSNGTVSAADAEGYIVNLTSVDGGWTIGDGAGNYLKYASGTSLGKTTDAYTWTIGEGVNGTWRVASATSSTRGLIFRAKTYNQFGGYSLSNATATSAEYYDVEILPIVGTVEPELPEVCTHENTTSQTTDATCTTAGKVVVSCKDCGEVLSTETIPALGHDYKYTSNNNGTHKITCSRCDYTASENCDLNNGTCPDCGYVEPTIPDEPEVPVGELKDGQYVIAANVDGVYYAMSNTFASKINGTPITVSNGTVSAADAEGYIVNLTSVDGGWTIDDGAGNYLKYASSTSLGKTTDAYTWTISEGINGTWRVASATSATRGLIFRAKTYNQFGGYSLSNATASSAEYYDVELLPIGGSQSVEALNLKLGHTLNLASDISMNYAVAVSALSGYSNYYVEVQVPTYEGNNQTGSKTVTLQPVVSGNYYYFTLTGLTAIQINDTLEATLYATKDGVKYASAVDTYSVATYAYNQLNKTGINEKLQILCAELLRYGAKAQIFKSYRTNAPADGNMTDAHKALLTDLNGVTFGNNNTTLNDVTNPTVTWVGKSLILDSKVVLRYVVNLSNYTGSIDNLSLRVSYVDVEGKNVTKTLNNAVVYNASKNQYAFDFSELRASELRTVLSAAVYEGNKQVSPTMKYSVDTYGNGRTGDLLILCQALVAYSDAALNYFQN